MNQLDPELRRLIRWARKAGTDSPAGPPTGSSCRFAARWRDAAGIDEPPTWQRLQFTASWCSLAIVAAGLVFWGSRYYHATTAYDFAPAYQLIAQNVAP